MGKRYTKHRSKKFERISQDAYDTPLSATWPLFQHLPSHARFAEPCAGKGRLIEHLTNNGFKCAYASDIKPRRRTIQKRDALMMTRQELGMKRIDVIITNPPWTHDVLMPMIQHFLKVGRPFWLLLDADWMHNKRTAGVLLHCSKIVAVGRVKWIEDSPSTGFDNCCWYCFEPHHYSGPIVIGRN